MSRLLSFAAAATALVAMFAGAAQAVGVIRIDKTDFSPEAGLITFSEFAVGTVNPSYAPADYGAVAAGMPTVDFDGWFAGQMLSANPGVDCPGGAPTGCVTGTPTGPLALDALAPNTFIQTDASSPDSPVLSGTPIFNGPIGVLFDVDLAGVGLDAGYFNAPLSTKIEVFARDGTSLGSVMNTGTGLEFLGLVTDDGSAAIAGLLFSLTGPEPAGFAIDNLRFGLPGQVGVIPEPGAVILFGIGALLAGRAVRRGTGD